MFFSPLLRFPCSTHMTKGAEPGTKQQQKMREDVVKLGVTPRKRVTEHEFQEEGTRAAHSPTLTRVNELH